MKKGFTLTELIGVVIILALIALLAFPPILNAIRETKSEISDASKEILYNAVGLYASNNSNSLPKTEGNVYCITIGTLIKGEYLPTKVYDSVTGEEISTDNIIEIKVENNNYSYNMNNNCVGVTVDPSDPEEEYYVDNSGANQPLLLNNMIPVKYDGTNWIYADIKEKWYDYDAKEWANAVVLNDGVSKKVGDTITESEIALWYVWIPRYKYQLFNADNGGVVEQEIKIKFETDIVSSGNVTCTDTISGTAATVSEICENAVNGNWYTHPAFTFGDQELTGFWVGKFEVSGSLKNITIKPNVKSFKATVSDLYYYNLNLNNIYDINGDSHMIKNMEWGAIAYLSHSKYGTCTNGECTEVAINSNSSFYTGGGTSNAYKTNVAQSTTGNIYGIYDMSGGLWEYVMGNMVNTNGLFYSSSSGFLIVPNSKYVDYYSYNTTNNSHGRGKLGDATKETLKTFGKVPGGWYGDDSKSVYSSYSWFNRGNHYGASTLAGIFSFGSYTGAIGDYGGTTHSILCA